MPTYTEPSTTFAKLNEKQISYAENTLMQSLMKPELQTKRKSQRLSHISSVLNKTAAVMPHFGVTLNQKLQAVWRT